MSQADTKKVRELLCALREERITDAQFKELEKIISQDPAAQELYLDFMLLCADLHKTIAFHPESLSIPIPDIDPMEKGSLFSPRPSMLEDLPLVDKTQAGKAQSSEQVDEIRQIAEQRLQAFLAEEEQVRRQQALDQRYQRTFSLIEILYRGARRTSSTTTWILRNAARLSVVTTLILLGLAATQYALRHRIVATLDEVVHSQWEQPPVDANLHPGPLFLKEGFAKLTFKQGAEIILQAPCMLDLSSKNKMILHQGMVTAQVPPRALGFAIETPQSTVTDFGTEFGVQVQDSTDSEVHVFDGRVQVKTTKRPHRQPQTRDVTNGRAAVISQGGGVDISGLNTRPKLFVRDMPDANSFSIPNKRLDLADIVGGGNGFGTGQLFACINPMTGQTAAMYRSERRTGEKGYVEVPSVPFVDGVFVPLAEGGLLPVSTAGHHFDFPPGGGSWFVELANGVEATHRDLPQPHGLLILKGQNYGTVTHPVLLMHANLGITFDLDAIRASLVGSCIKRFTSVCGINNDVKKTKTPDAVIYVLVDGQVRFYKKIALPADPAVPIQIELREDERFLTLVCMAGTENLGDWTFFGVPALELGGEG